MDKKNIKITRDIRLCINGLKRSFKAGQIVGGKLAGWFPVDSYEWYEKEAVVPTPNEIVVEYDG